MTIPYDAFAYGIEYYQHSLRRPSIGDPSQMYDHLPLQIFISVFIIYTLACRLLPAVYAFSVNFSSIIMFLIEYYGTTYVIPTEGILSNWRKWDIYT